MPLLGVRSATQRVIRRWISKITFDSADLKFIAVLWSSEFIDPWGEIWASESPKIISLHHKSDAQTILIYYLVLLVAKLLVTIGVSLAVDLKNHKFAVYFISLIVYACAPVIGIITSFVYDIVLRCILLTLISSLFVSRPAKFCLIFNQSPGAGLTESRIIVAIFEMITCLSQLVLFTFFFLSENTMTQRSVVIVWACLFGCIVGLTVLTYYVKKYKTEEIITEPTFPAVCRGIRRDVVKKPRDSPEVRRQKTLSVRRFVVFILLLLPVLVITSIDVTLTAIDSIVTENDDSPRKVYKFLAKLVAIPTLVLLFAGTKGAIAKASDMLIIAIAHAFNTVVVLLIVLFLNSQKLTIDARQSIEISNNVKDPNLIHISGEIPDPNKAIVRIFGVTKSGRPRPFHARNVFYESVLPEFFAEMTAPIQKAADIQTMMWLAREPPREFQINFEPNKRHWYLLYQENNEITTLSLVNGVEQVNISATSKLLVVNGIVGDADPATFQKFSYENLKTGVKKTIDLTRSNETLNIDLKPGSYIFKYGTAQTPPVDLEPYCEYAAVIYQSDQMRIDVHGTVMMKLKTEKKLVHASHAVSGLTQAVTQVGYIHFFWMESPVRLRTTLFAGFIVINDIVAKATKLLLGDFGVNEALIYLGLSGFAGLYHISLGYLYSQRYSRHQDDEETESEESTESD